MEHIIKFRAKHQENVTKSFNQLTQTYRDQVLSKA